MRSPVPQILQLAYAELLQRTSDADFNQQFPPNETGTFISKRIKDRTYWYRQVRDKDGARKQIYVGPETDELLTRIANHKQRRDDLAERKNLVSTLLRSGYFVKPTDAVAQIMMALADAGFFRLRGVLVGTIAYQTYGAMLGVRLPIQSFATNDLDIAQDAAISLALKDEHLNLLDVLRRVDPKARANPHRASKTATTTYTAAGIQVDVLTTNRGPNTDTPQLLPALGTHATALRHLDHLIYQPVPAVLLYDAGIRVTVPDPARYAIHKLIVAQGRHTGSGKVVKDLIQAEALVDAILPDRNGSLLTAWNEAYERGPKWRKELFDSLASLGFAVRDRLLQRIGAPRALVPGAALHFEDIRPRYDLERASVVFTARDQDGNPIFCVISRETLDDRYGADKFTQAQRVELFHKNRSEFEAMLRHKYLKEPLSSPEPTLFLGTLEFESFRAKLEPSAKRKRRST
ncbi:MAG: DUF1488 family protein [Proteobacteria bacterium]|nr:DUF1488 family protein [Pseudomonadota bacterium]MBI3496088.1 DUF1488 family protein [Pseudomonadota bacterium]